jgi:hypothetical protein
MTNDTLNIIDIVLFEEETKWKEYFVSY